MVSSVLLAAISFAQNGTDVRVKEHVRAVTGRVEAIRARWRMLSPKFAGGPYAETPSAKAPYRSGRLQSAFVADGLNTLNFARFVAGLPDDVRIDEARQTGAQWGAVLNLANGELSHTPDRPADMPEPFFKLGYDATSSSNLGMGYDTLARAVEGFLSDTGVSSLGHRRWCLNYDMATTAFGYANGPKRADSPYPMEFTAMRSFDDSRPSAPGWNVVTWPAQGAFPSRLMVTGMAWSLHLNPKEFGRPASESQVQVVRLGDGKSWTFEGANLAISEPGYGQQWCLIFTPKVGAAQPGQVYEITVRGLRPLRGEAKPFVYRVLVFDVESAAGRI